MIDTVRFPIVAGAFYPARPDVLRGQLRGLLGENPQAMKTPLASSVGLVAPHAGYVYSGHVAAAGFREVARLGRPDAVVVLGASHTGLEPWLALSPHSRWATPLGQSPAHADIVSRLISGGVEQAHAPFTHEHSIEVQLPFIQHLWGTETPIVPMCVAPASPQAVHEAAVTLLRVLHDHRVVVIASSDFTHYQPAEVARALDARALDRIVALDDHGFRELCRDRQLTICGTGAIGVLMSLARLSGWTARVVAYGTSGDVTGDMSSVVGYASVLMTKENHG
jgi:MEMO1 family protein